MLMKSEHRKELVSEIRSLAQSQGLNTVFTTFLEITANSLAAQTDPENTEKREQRYQEMASTMTPELLSSYARMLALLFLTVREYGAINKEAPLIVFKISLTTLASRLCRRWLNIIPFALSKHTITVIDSPPSSFHRCSQTQINSMSMNIIADNRANYN